MARPTVCLYNTCYRYITDGRGLSNKVRHELLPKQEQGNAVFAVPFIVRPGKAHSLFLISACVYQNTVAVTAAR